MPHRVVMPRARAVDLGADRGGHRAGRTRPVLVAALLALVAALASLMVGYVTTDAASAAPGCDKYAATNGSDGAPGTISAPFATAQELADSLSAGQVGCLLGGTYAEAGGNLIIKNAGVTLTSTPGEQATIAARAYVPEGSDGATVSNLKLEGGGGAVVIVRAEDTRWLGNDVINGNSDGSCFLVGPATGTEIRGNRIHDCGLLPSTGRNHGVYVSAGVDTTIADNLIYDNADRGVQLYPDAQGTLVEGNIIDGNGEGVVINAASSDNMLRGNVLSDPVNGRNVYTGAAASGSGNLVERNCVWTQSGASGVEEEVSYVYVARDNVVADPGFSGGDLTLAPDSPCRSVY